MIFVCLLICFLQIIFNSNTAFLPGCLQSMYGIHTFRVKSIGRRKTSPVDEVQFLGISDPHMLRKVNQNIYLLVLYFYFIFDPYFYVVSLLSKWELLPLYMLLIKIMERDLYLKAATDFAGDNKRSFKDHTRCE